jgi:hypothetical protein
LADVALLRRRASIMTTCNLAVTILLHNNDFSKKHHMRHPAPSAMTADAARGDDAPEIVTPVRGHHVSKKQRSIQ